MIYPLLKYNGKRPNGSKEDVEKELIEYLKERYKQEHIPSKRELQNRFRLRIDCKIEELYRRAGLNYKLPANQEMKYKKAKTLLKIIIENMSRFNLELIESRDITERGIDIIAKRGNRKIGIELKAYNKFEKIKAKNIEQAKRFFHDEKLDEVLIISTSDLKEEYPLPRNIKIIMFTDMYEILEKDKYSDQLNFIRNSSTNVETAGKELNRLKIIDYVSNTYSKEGKKPSCVDISKKLHVNIYTYFGSLFDIYKKLNIAPPIKNMGGLRARRPDKKIIEMWKRDFKRFILEEIEKGNKFPSGEEIGKHFGISHIWNITKVSELYRELGLKPYLERKSRFRPPSHSTEQLNTGL